MTRIKSVLERLDNEKLDGILLINNSNIRYVSGYTGADAFVVISARGCAFITDPRYTEQAERECFGFEIVNHRQPNLNVIGAIKQVCEAQGINKLGFEREHVSYDLYEKLTKEMSKVEIVATSGIVENIRGIKDEEEIGSIKKAAEIADAAFVEILKFIKVGVSEKEIERELQYFIKKQGAEDIAFASIIASGKNSSLPHANPSDKLVENGDFVTLDFGAIYNGYRSDMTRTVVVGKPSEKQLEIYEVVKGAQEAACNFVKARVLGKAADSCARDHITKAGYGDNFGHGLGHGVGLDIHEMPSLSTGSTSILEAGNIVTIEPGVYLPNWGGVRIEDTVLVTEDGIEILTKSSKELIILE